jgi:hypothetical protein
MAVGTQPKQGYVEQRTGRIECSPAISLPQKPFVAPGRISGLASIGIA